jgi:hypothetical protein
VTTAARPEVVRRIDELLAFCDRIGKKRGFVYFAIVRERDGDINVSELIHIQTILGYKRTWITYKIDELRTREKEGYFKYDTHWHESRHRQERYETREDDRAPAHLLDSAKVLGLRWPTTIDRVRDAFRTASKTAHPDGGGSNEAFIKIKRAADLLMEWLDDEPPF